MSDLASSNDVVTNGVNGRIGYKLDANVNAMCYALVETSVEGVCCLEILLICKQRFPSTLCLNVCRLDPDFVL